MKKLMINATIGTAVMLAASVSFAQADKPAGEPPKQDAAAAAAPAGGKMEGPKPPKELEEAVKTFSGKWKCAGKEEGNPMMPAHKIEGTLTWKSDLDKYWMAGTYEEKKTKENPHPFRFTEYRTFDGTTKKWATVMVDNMGMYATGTGEGDMKSMKWDVKSQGMGMLMPIHITDEVKSAKEFSVKGEGAMDGTSFKPMFEIICKK